MSSDLKRGIFVICDYGWSLTLGFDVVLQLQLISLPIVSLRVFSLSIASLPFLFSSANLFKLFSLFLHSPSLISKPQPLVGSWGPAVCVCVCVCVCFSGTVLSQWAECEKRQTERERERLRKSRLSFWTTEENWARNQRDLSRARQRGVQAPGFISGAPQTRELRRQTQQERERGEIKERSKSVCSTVRSLTK